MLNFSMSSTDPGRLSFIINVPIVNKCVLRFCILFSLIDKEKIDRRVFEKYFYSFDILSSGVNYLIGGKFSGWKFASEGFRYRILNRKIFSQKTLTRREILALFSWTHFETISISKLHIHAYSFFTIYKLKNTIITYLSFYSEQKLIDNIICNNEWSL